MAWITGGAILGGALLASNASQDASKTMQNAAGQTAAISQRQFDETSGNLAPYRAVGLDALRQLGYLSGLGPAGSAGPGGGGYSFDDFLAYNNRVAPKTYGAQGDDAKMQYDRYLKGGYGDDAAVAKQFGFEPVAAGAAPGGSQGDFGSLTKPFTLADFNASPAYNFNLSEGEKAINKAAASRGAYYNPATLQDIAKFSQGLASNEFQNAFQNYNTTQGNIFSRLSQISGSGQNAAVQQGNFGAQNVGNQTSAFTGGANAAAAGQVGTANAVSGALGQGANAYLMSQILAQNQRDYFMND